jgi:hypothetical protein
VTLPADPRAERVLWIAIGAVVPFLIATALIPLRDSMRNANVALVLVAAVVVLAVLGGWEAGACAAVVSALSFDFFFTQPYDHFTIASRDDVETTILLLTVGLVVGMVASRGRRARSSARAREHEIRRIYRVANLASRGEEAADVIMAAQAELISLLQLRDCRFEAPPFHSDEPRLERSGILTDEPLPRDEVFELPASGVELAVVGRGQLLGRFVLDPSPGVGVTLAQRVVAVALSDQVGAVLAAPDRGREISRG